jgi:predicted ATPase
MVNAVQIQNYKSIVSLSLDLGVFNVLIGENGSGKSNILEAIAFGAAASADKLDFEFLGSRGIRVTNAESTFSAFPDIKANETIEIDFTIEDTNRIFKLMNDPTNSKKWIDQGKKDYLKTIRDLLELIDKVNAANKQFEEDFKKGILSEQEKSNFDKTRDTFNASQEKLRIIYNRAESESQNPNISNYIIYSPEQSSLRKFEETAQIYPLGIKGEGLFQYLREIAQEKNGLEKLKEIKEALSFLDWFEDFEIPENSAPTEFSINIKDRFIEDSLKHLDQRSTNEGFLFLLFYSTLVISELTPRFFAIDNIDVSFNPKLCIALTRSLIDLCKKHNKQLIVTTHNPAVLDGLNLNDKDQRLFVVRRNEEGHTIASKIDHKNDRKLKLSEVWTSGFIGGLPENF